MKVIYCPKCNQTQKVGKYCPTDGTVLVVKVTKEMKRSGSVGQVPIETSKSKIVKWLEYIGVGSVDFSLSGNTAKISYVLDNKKYDFVSMNQSNVKSNLAAIQIFIHHRVLGIQRGIETAEQAFSGYHQLPAPGDESSTKNWYFFGYSTQSSARALYLDLCKKLHPDQNGGHSEQFNEMKKQWDMLPKGN